MNRTRRLGQVHASKHAQELHTAQEQHAVHTLTRLEVVAYAADEAG